MKRIKAALLALCLFAALTLSGCSAQKIEAAADEFILAVSLESKDPIYRLSCEYFLDGELLGGLSCENADGTEMLDPCYYFDFEEENFPEGASLSGFSARFFVTKAPGAADISAIASHECQIEVEGEIALPAQTGNVYPIRVEGEGERYTVREEYLRWEREEADGAVLLRRGASVYEAYCTVENTARGEKLGFVGGDTKDEIYEYKGLDSQEWIVSFYHSGLMDNSMIYKERGVREIPPELARAYRQFGEEL